jgi:hypothetical protein
MANELQIRLSADITALTTALNKAKATIKSFEESTDKESEKGNVGFKHKIGLIEQLTNKAKNLRTALSQATNETQIAKYNAELEETSRELTRLNALGRSVSTNLGSTANGFGQVARQGANANGVAQEFNRIIQDAPFGLIGIGNNLQQLAGNFSNVSKAAGGTGAAIKASLASIISPVNLGLLAVSALTAGFTAYQMGAFDGILATKDFGEELEKFRESLSEVDSARFESLKNTDQEIIKLNSLRDVIEDETVSRDKRLLAVKELRDQFPTISKNLSDEAFLAGQVAGAYEEVVKQLVAKAQLESTVKRIVDLNDQERLILDQNKSSLEEITATRERIATLQDQANKQAEILANSQDASEKDLALRRKLTAENTIRFLRNENEAVNQLLRIEEDRNNLQEVANNALKETLVNTEEVTKATEQNIEVAETQAERLGLISSLTKQINDLVKERDLAKTQEEVNLITGKINLLREELSLINAIAKRANTPVDTGIDTSGLPARDGNLPVTSPNIPGVIIPTIPTDEFKSSAEEIVNINKTITDSFGALGTAIAANLDIQNDAVKGFVSTVLSNAPRIIQAVLATAQANKVAANANIGTAKKGALANGIFMATETGKSLGPIGLALLPVLIGGALALISGAFNGGGGGGGSIPSASAGSGRPPQIFTNANTVTPPSPSNPTPSGSIDFDKAQGRLDARVSGEDIVFVYDRFKERQRGGG